MSEQSQLTYQEFYESHHDVLLGHHLSENTINCRIWMFHDVIGPEFSSKRMLLSGSAELENFLDKQRLLYRPGTVYSFFCFLYRMFSLLEMETHHPNPLTGLRARYDPKRLYD